MYLLKNICFPICYYFCAMYETSNYLDLCQFREKVHITVNII